MSLVDVDTWLIEYDACERLGHDIQSQIVLRNQTQVTEEYGRISATIRTRIKQFSVELEQLNAKLGAREDNQTAAEIERRQRQLEKLQSKLFQLQQQFANKPAAKSAISAGASSLWEDDDDDEDSILDNKNYTVADVRRQQIKVLEDQNTGLDNLSRVIARQKELASRIGNEVDIQNDLIDDIADNMERVETRVGSSTAQVVVVGQRDNTCGYWTLIIILFVCIVIVAIL